MAQVSGPGVTLGQLAIAPFDGKQFTAGDAAWVTTASALVWLMLPGLGFFYSGLTGKKSALSMIMLSFIAMSVGAVQVPFPSSLADSAVVYMRILAHIFQNSKSLHREPGPHCVSRSITTNRGRFLRSSFRTFSWNDCGFYSRVAGWCGGRTRTSFTLYAFCICLGHSRLRSYCVLDLEFNGLGL
jgi:Ammonium Transporter Family